MLAAWWPQRQQEAKERLNCVVFDCRGLSSSHSAACPALHTLVILVLGQWRIIQPQSVIQYITDRSLLQKQANKLHKQTGRPIKFRRPASCSRSSTVLIDSLLVGATMERDQRHNITVQEQKTSLTSAKDWCLCSSSQRDPLTISS